MGTCEPRQAVEDQLYDVIARNLGRSESRAVFHLDQRATAQQPESLRGPLTTWKAAQHGIELAATPPKGPRAGDRGERDSACHRLSQLSHNRCNMH